MNNYLGLKENKFCGNRRCDVLYPHTHKSIFSSWARFYHWLYHRLFGHKMCYEFKRGEMDKVWRGDKWCKYCSWCVLAHDFTRLYMPPMKIEEPLV